MRTKSLVLALLISAGVFTNVNAKDKDKLSKEEFEAQVLEVIKNNPEFIEETMKAYVTEKNKKAQEEEFKQRLTNRADIKTGSSPKAGKDNAKYKLVLFTDFECPYCSRAEERVKELQERYDVQVIYKNNPLPFHQNAKPAAIAALAAHEQNKFFEYKDLLFKNQTKLNDDLYIQLANELKLDIEKFKADLTKESLAKQIAEDIKQAQELQITGTPTFYLNGVKIEGAVPIEEFDKVIKSL